MYQTEFVYDFKGELRYAKDGIEKVAQNVCVKAPSGIVLDEFSVIDSMVQKADQKLLKDQQSMFANMSKEKISEIIELGKQFEQVKKEEKTGTQLVNELSAGEFDVKRGIQSLLTILEKSRSLIDGAVPFTSVMGRDICIADAKELLGQYIKLFLLESRA